MVEVSSIVDPETWEAARTAAKENWRQAKRNTRHNYLLRRRVICSDCGSTMGSESRSNGRGTVRLYYRCIAHSHRYGGARQCNTRKSFRSDRVDSTVWTWIKSFLGDPSVLAEGLQAQQEKHEEDNAPLRQRMEVIKDLLANNERQMERLLDLYLSSDFPSEVLAERKERLHTTIDALEKERAMLEVKLEVQTLTDGQVESIMEFAARVGAGLAEADQDFDKRRWLIEILDVRAWLGVEDEEQIAHVQCLLGDSVLSIATGSRKEENCQPGDPTEMPQLARLPRLMYTL